MRLAILGTDPDVIDLMAAAVDGGHEIVWLAEMRPEDRDAVGRLLPHLEISQQWELVLDHATAEAVIVGRGTAGDVLKEEQLKRLTADAIPLLAVHPATTSMLLTYELDMTRRAAGGMLRHYNPLINAEMVAELARMVGGDDNDAGAIHQISCQRHLAGDSREAVFSRLARDAELLEAISGRINKVTGVGPRDVDASYISLQAQMVTPGEANLGWSSVPATGNEAGMRLRLISARGTLDVWFPERMTPGDPWQVETTLDGNTKIHPSWQYNGPATAIADLAAALDQTRRDPTAEVSTWDVATRSMEVVDAIELSLQKGRTIEVHYQQLTERLAFRGTMSAIGCGLLVLGTIVLLVAGLFGDVLRVPGVRFWPLGLLIVLGLFLLLQTLPLLLAKRVGSAASKERGSPPSAEDS